MGRHVAAAKDDLWLVDDPQDRRTPHGVAPVRVLFWYVEDTRKTLRISALVMLQSGGGAFLADANSLRLHKDDALLTWGGRARSNLTPAQADRAVMAEVAADAADAEAKALADKVLREADPVYDALRCGEEDADREAAKAAGDCIAHGGHIHA